VSRILGLAALAAVLAVPALAAPRVARVALLDRDPVKVVGTGFAARERVAVKVVPTKGVAFTKVVVAAPNGRFVATWPTQELDPCSGYRIVAVGNSGTRAGGRELPPPCGPDIIP
jgi:hypothetical protein